MPRERRAGLAEPSRARAQDHGHERGGSPAGERGQVDRREKPGYGCSSATITCMTCDQGMKI